MTKFPIAMPFGLALALALSAAPGPACADILLLQRETGPSPDGRGERVSEKEIAIAQDKMRVTDLSTGDEVIVRLDRRVVWEFPPDASEYIEIPFEYLEKMKNAGTMSEDEILEAQIGLAEPKDQRELRRALAEARRRRASETPEERTLRESLQAERLRTAEKTPAVSWSGRTERIAGFACREAVLSIDSTKVAEVWVTDDPFFRGELSAYVEAMRSLSAAGGGGATDLTELGGFPMRTLLYPIGPMRGAAAARPLVLEIVEARRESFAPWDFDIPPGMTRAAFLPEGPSR